MNANTVPSSPAATLVPVWRAPAWYHRQRVKSSLSWTQIHVLLVIGLCSAGLASGCGGDQSKRKPTGGPWDQPRLDIREDWNDPEADFTPAVQAGTIIAHSGADPRVNDAAPTLAIVGGTVMTATGQRYERGTVITSKGKIDHVGDGSVPIPEGAQVIDASGRFVTPGIIDTHSHIGVYAAPGVNSHSDGNESTGPMTAQARAEYGYWPQDPKITRALAGGVTTAQILPGSANLVGGLGFTVIMRPGRSADDVRFPGAPPTIKMACGENPKRVYGDKGGPRTRMAEYAAFRQYFHKAREYNAKLAAYQRQRAVWLKKKARAEAIDRANEKKGKKKFISPTPAPSLPGRDLALENLAGVLRGDVLVQIHCYRAPEIRELVAIADEFGFKIRSFHHALEAYKVRDILVEHDIAINTWADSWGFKMEAFDGIPHNAALFAASGGRAVIHSDSAIGIQRLNQEAAKAMWSGRHAGIDISDDEALRWITANPAWVLGIHEVTGTLEAGKRADVVVWNRTPLSVYATADTVIQGGVIAYRRQAGKAATDFEVGNSASYRQNISQGESK